MTGGDGMGFRVGDGMTRFIVQLDGQAAYGPFDNDYEAHKFADFLRTEVDPATVIKLSNPLIEVLSWWNSATVEIDRLRAENAEALDTLTEMAPLRGDALRQAQAEVERLRDGLIAAQNEGEQQAAEVERLRKQLDEAQTTIRAFVKPGGTP